MHNVGVLGGFYIIADWIYRFAIVNLIWVLFNIPLVFLLFNLLLADTMGVVFVLTGMIFLLAPFILYPSTTALFAMVNCFIKKEDVKIFHDFWLYYKTNYKRSMRIGIVLAVFWIVLLIDFIYVVQAGNSVLTYIFIVLGFFVFIYQLLVCSGVNYIHGRVLDLFKHVATVMFGHPILSMSLGFISIVFLYIITQMLAIFLPFFSGSILAFLSLLVFIKINPEEKHSSYE
ncbi:DUF624 domain-containing protein [Gracilibacillus xinjiangensis]|uniref:DUF624 domain-containing protein n=1 Tax=Gracilibacillus xinjiangensis TaxID=1193282 RepID=A0ABV8WQL6_9BACI